MPMTLEQYILNPMGKNNAVISALTRESIRVNYGHRFDNVLLREHGKIDYYKYRNKAKNTYFIHVKVPSEVVENFYYDVVFKFYTDASIKNAGRTLTDYYVQFYSNDPAFVFTYANTFMSHGLFIKELAPRMSRDAIKHKAKEKNPENLNGYVKSIYFAYLFMKQRGLLNTTQYGDAPEINFESLLNNIMSADKKIELRQEEEKKRDKRKKIVLDDKMAKRISRVGLSDKAASRIVTTTTKTTGVKKTKAINSIQRSKTIGKKK